jgi:hypothetical protein
LTRRSIFDILTITGCLCSLSLVLVSQLRGKLIINMDIKYIYGYIAEIIEDQYLLIRRRIISTYQKLRYGSSDQECWNLYRTIARYNLQKLQYFKNMQRMGHPAEMTENDWSNQIDEIIWAYDYILNDEKYNPIPDCGELKLIKKEEEDISRVEFITEPSCKKRWEEYNKKAQELEIRKKKALVWFAENFETFWD